MPLPVRTLFVAPWGERLGGAEVFLDTFLRRADKRRVQCHVVMLADGPWHRELRAEGIPTTVMPAGRLRLPIALTKTAYKLRRHIGDIRPDVVVGWAPKAHVYASAAALAMPKRPALVWLQHGIPAGHWMDRLATLMPADCVVCCSHAAALGQARMHPYRELRVIWPGVELPAADDDEKLTRESLGIIDRAHVIGIVGRLQPWKNQHRVILAISRLLREGEVVHLLVVGGTPYGFSPEYPAQLRALVRRLGVESAVTFTGQVANVRPYYRLMDVAVNASRGEPFGLVVVEAMAHGVPVVAVDDGGPQEILRAEAGGLLVPSNGVDDIVTGIRKLLQDEELRRRLGERGRRRARESFSAERMTRELEGLLVSLADSTDNASTD